jgi:hypothetical protein
MSTEFAKRVEDLAGNLNSMKTDVIEIKNQLKEIHYALIGNNLGQEGLVSRVQKLEEAKKKYERNLLWAGGYIFGVSSLMVGIVELLKYLIK